MRDMIFVKTASIFVALRNLKTNKERKMKRKGFKKETLLTLMKGEKEIIDVPNIVHMDVILNDDERPRWIIDFSLGRHLLFKGRFQEKKGKFKDRKMVIILGDLTRLYAEAKDNVTLVF